MSDFLDRAKEKTKTEAENFIKLIKSNKIKKRILPNEFVDFPETEAYESFDNFTKSKEFENIIKDTYK